MKRSIPALFLCFALLAGCSTQSTSQNKQPIERFTLNVIGQQQVSFDGKLMTITAFGDKLENLRFAENAQVKVNINKNTPMGDVTDVQTLLRKHNLLKITYAQLN